MDEVTDFQNISCLLMAVTTRDVRFVSPQENLQRTAQMMDELKVGALGDMVSGTGARA